ncbi:MAG TPA: hypothetical protein VG501_03675 [Rhizomicrobium sp.]|nr:hypothetical protein [Rhizomicrobium sp.]
MIRMGISVLALTAMTAQAYAADLCDAGAAAALKTSALQQEMMVAGLTCNQSGLYNRFVISHRAELQDSDVVLLAYFRSRDGGSEAGYDSYKTKMANLSAARSAEDGMRYCRAMARGFAAADRVSLSDFVAGERLLVAEPEPCALKYEHLRYETADVAVEGPNTSIPALPYGAPDQVASATYDNDSQPPVQTAPPSGYQGPAVRTGPSYYGRSWPPPRPTRRAPRWDPWYGRYMYY